MDLYEAIYNRRTTRIFKEPASEEQVKKLLMAGVKAPSAGNQQSWEFIQIDEQALINKLASIKYDMNRKFEPVKGQTQEDVDRAARHQQKAFANATVIAVCSGKGKAADGWLAVENILLASTADGLGSGIILFKGDSRNRVEQLLDIPEDHELVCVLKIGVSGEKPKRKESREDFSWFYKNKFNQ